MGPCGAEEFGLEHKGPVLMGVTRSVGQIHNDSCVVDGGGEKAVEIQAPERKEP